MKEKKEKANLNFKTAREKRKFMAEMIMSNPDAWMKNDLYRTKKSLRTHPSMKGLEDTQIFTSACAMGMYACVKNIGYPLFIAVIAGQPGVATLNDLSKTPQTAAERIWLSADV